VPKAPRFLRKKVFFLARQQHSAPASGRMEQTGGRTPSSFSVLGEEVRAARSTWPTTTELQRVPHFTQGPSFYHRSLAPSLPRSLTHVP